MSQESLSWPESPSTIKDATGCSQSQLDCGSLHSDSTNLCSICADKEKEEKEDLNTGKYSLPLKRKLDFLPSNATLLENAMRSYQDRPPRMLTSGKKKQGLKELSLNLVNGRSDGIVPQIGIELEPMQLAQLLTISQQTFTFVIMGISEELLQTMLDRLQWFELAKCLLEPLARAKVDWPGMKQDRMLTLRIQQRSGGTVIKVHLITYRSKSCYHR